MKVHPLPSLLVTIVLLSCGRDRMPTEPPAARSFTISDGVHNAGNAHFFFLPPMVPPPSYGGIADGSLSPSVTVCEWNSVSCLTTIAEFSRQTGTASEVVRYDSAASHYIVDWHTDQCVAGPCTLDPAKMYRVRVRIGNQELGFADVKVVSTGKELKNVVTGETIGLVNGRTLPIKFRIEEGAQHAPAPLFVSVRLADAIMTFSSDASGDVAPTSVLQGTNTGLHQPYGLVHDDVGNLIVANYTSNSITAYAPDASGDAAPIRTIQGPSTGLNGPVGIALDALGRIYVTNDLGQSITVFSAAANGDAAPVVTIRGSNTLLSGPAGIVVDQTGRIYVANTCCGSDIAGNRITVYASDADGDVSPVATIAGSNTGLSRPYGLAMNNAGQLYVSSSNNAAIYVFGSNANGDVPPSNSIQGAATGLSSPNGLGFGSNGALFVANWGSRNVLVFSSLSTGNASPIASIGGINTRLTDPIFVGF